MIEILVFLIWLGVVVVLTTKCVFKQGDPRLKTALAICYVLFIAEIWNVYDNAEAADNGIIPAGGTGWLGHWWFPALLILFVTITTLHLQIRSCSRRTMKVEGNAEQ